MRSKLLATAITLTLFLSILIPAGSAKAAVIGEFECFPAVLMLRGSDEHTLKDNEGNTPVYKKNGFDQVATNGNEGETIGRLLSEFVSKTDPTETVSKVRFIGVEYDALSVPGLPVTNGAQGDKQSLDIFDHLLKYDESYRQGAKKVLSIINDDEMRGCNTKYLLVGYSQGVISVRIAMHLLDNDTDKIFGSYVIGDPFQKANGAQSGRQKSLANTSSDTYGVGNVAATTLSVSLLNPIFYPVVPLVESYRNDKTFADPLIYQDSQTSGQFSRSLCHEYDPVCGPKPGFEMGNHMNYFLAQADIDHEIDAFDSQVQLLANSSPSDTSHRTRVLKGTVAVDGRVTYNVVNSVPGSIYNLNQDDKCYWDIDSDGIEESISAELNPDSGSTDCRNVDFVHTESPAEMTVRIVDSFGITHMRSIEVEEVSREIIENAYKLDPDKWYQLRPVENDSKCLGFTGQDNYENVSVGVQASILNCENTTPTDFTEKSALAKQTFKAEPHHASNYPGEWDEFGTRLAWGYDDDYNMDSPNSFETSGPLGLQMNDNYSSHHFEPHLAKIENGIPYYFIRHRDGNCVTVDDFEKVNINWACDGYPERQLFSATAIDGDFGNLSLEKDATAPSSVQNLTVSDIRLGYAELHWDNSVDDRLGEVEYEVYSKNDDVETLLTTTADTSTSLALETAYHVNKTFVIKSIDASGNRSAGEEISFDTFSQLRMPDAPTLESMSDLGDEVVINLPYNQDEAIEKMAVYRNGEFLGFSDDGLYSDSGLTAGLGYAYSYKTITSYGLYSPMSWQLWVEPRNNIAPSAPSNLSLNWQDLSSVFMNWTPAEDDTDSNLTYYIYRDGVRLESSYYAQTNEGADFSAVPGSTHIYTIQAEDSYGNLSAASNELSVTIPELDTTPPTAPTDLSVLMRDGNTLYLSWTPGQDDSNGQLFYNLYRDGVKLTENYTAQDSWAADYDVTVGSTYVYTATVTDSSGNESGFSEPLVVTIEEDTGEEPDVNAPTKPQLQLNDVQADNANFSFYSEDDQGIAYFEIYRDGVQIGTTYDYFYYDSPLTPDTTYEYTVVATDNSGNVSEISDPLVVTTSVGVDPNAPVPAVESIYSQYVVHNAIQFGWSINNQTGLTYYYDVYRNGVLVAENRSYNPYAEGINTDPFTYTDLGLEPDTTYTYQIVIKKQNGESSPMSTPLSLHILPAPTSSSDEVRPSGVAMTIATNEYGLGIRWTPAVDDVAVASYKIYRDDVLLHTVTVNGTNHGNFYDDVTAVGSPEGTAYSYKIVVVDSSGNENAISLPMEVIVY